MISPRVIFGLILGASGAGAARGAEPGVDRGAAAELAPGPTVELPPMIVTDTPNSVPWLYATAKGDEYLSRCSPRTTLRYIEADQRLVEGLREIVPDEFLARLPSITLLSDATLAPKASDLVALEVARAEKSPQVSAGKSGPVKYLPSLSIDGRDLSAMFAYLDETEFNRTRLLLTTKDLRFRLERRTPMLPPWLVEGVLAVHAQINVLENPVTLRPFIWISPEESRAIGRNPTRRGRCCLRAKCSHRTLCEVRTINTRYAFERSACRSVFSCAGPSIRKTTSGRLFGTLLDARVSSR